MKTWVEKRDCDKEVRIKTIEKRFADIPQGSKMLILAPQVVDEYIRYIPFGTKTELTTLRSDLARERSADKTCPVTTGIFLRIVSEAAYEELTMGKKLEEITPFWRVVHPNMPVAKKLACGIPFIEEQREKEGITF